MTRIQSKTTAAPSPLWTVEAEAIATHALIEVRRYDFPRPNEMWEIDDAPIFSMSLPRPGGAHGTVQYEAGATPAQKVGTMMLRPGNVRMHSIGDGGVLHIMRCRFDNAAFASVTALADWDPERLKKCAALHSAPLADVTKRLRKEVVTPGFGGSLAIDSYVNLILVEIGRAFRSRKMNPRVKGGLAPWQLARIDERLRVADGAWPSVEELAAECRVSRSHLSRAFVETTGATLADHAANLRVARAKELMTASDLTMSDIAERLGFASPSAFGAAFRRATGLSPLQYSRTVRGA